MKSSFWVIFLIVILVAACTNNNKALNEADSATATVTVTTTPIPSTTATATVTFTPTFTSTPTVPAAILTPVPDHSQVINASNVDQLTEMAHWGNGQLYSLRLSSDGAKVIAVFSTGVRVFDAKSLVELSNVDTPIPNQYVVGWAVSPNGERLIVLDENAILTIWQLTNGKKIGSMTLNRDQDIGCASDPANFILSADNNTLGIFGDCNGYSPHSRVLLIRTSDLKILLKLEGKGLGLFSPDGKYFVTYGMGGYDKDYTVKLWRTSDGQLLHDFESEKPVGCPRTYSAMGKSPWPPTTLWGNETSCVAFSPDSQKLAIGFQDATYLFNVADGSGLGLFTAGRPWFSADGQMLFLDINNYQSIGYDLTTSKHLDYSSTFAYPISSPDGIYLVGIWEVKVSEHSYDLGGIILRDIKAGKNIVQIKGYSGSVFSPDGKFIALYAGASESKPILLLQTPDGKLLNTLNNETSPVFLPDGKSLLTVSGNNLIIRTLPGGEINYTITNAAWPEALPDGGSLITLEGNHITRRRTSDGAVLATQPFPVSPENLMPAGTNILETSVSGNRFLTLPKLTYQQEFGAATILSPDGMHYAISLMDSVEVWKAYGPSEPVYTILTGGQNRVDFSLDGDLIGIDKMNGDLEVRIVQTGDLIQTLKIGLSKRIDQLAFSLDQYRLYIIAEQNSSYSLMGWKLTDGAALSYDSVKNDGPIAISPDSKYLAFEREPGKIAVVQIQGWLPIHTLEYGNGGIEQMAFSPNGGLLVSATAYGEIQLWELSTGTLVRTIVGNLLVHQLAENYYENKPGWAPKSQFGVSVSFSPDGRFLLSTADGVARIWGVP